MTGSGDDSQNRKYRQVEWAFARMWEKGQEELGKEVQTERICTEGDQ